MVRPHGASKPAEALSLMTLPPSSALSNAAAACLASLLLLLQARA